MAILFATKNHLRADWGAFSDMGSCGHPLVRREVAAPEAAELMPPGFVGNESQGLGVTLQLTVLLESYIKRGFERGWWHAPQASQLSVQLNNLVTAYGRMETIRLTPVPVSHLYVVMFSRSIYSLKLLRLKMSTESTRSKSLLSSVPSYRLRWLLRWAGGPLA